MRTVSFLSGPSGPVEGIDARSTITNAAMRHWHEASLSAVDSSESAVVGLVTRRVIQLIARWDE
jgi:hypothetical protein